MDKIFCECIHKMLEQPEFKEIREKLIINKMDIIRKVADTPEAKNYGCNFYLEDMKVKSI